MEKNEGEVLDVVTGDSKEEEKEIFVPPENLSILTETANTIDHLRLSIGAMEGRKLKMLTQIESLQSRVEEAAKESMIKAGIPEDKLEEYNIEIKTGKIVSNSFLRENDQKIRNSRRQ